MPISRDFSRSARSSSGSSCTSTSTSMPSAKAAASRFGRRRVVERRHDDEDAIGAGRARLRHLVGVVHEILAQHRQRAGRARRAQVIERALEGGRVGQHRKAGRAALRVGRRQGRRIEIVADQPLRGACLLDLGDQRIVAGGEPALDRLQEAARRARGLCFGFEGGRADAARFAAAISSRL